MAMNAHRDYSCSQRGQRDMRRDPRYPSSVRFIAKRRFPPLIHPSPGACMPCARNPAVTFCHETHAEHGPRVRGREQRTKTPKKRNEAKRPREAATVAAAESWCSPPCLCPCLCPRVSLCVCVWAGERVWGCSRIREKGNSWPDPVNVCVSLGPALSSIHALIPVVAKRRAWHTVSGAGKRGRTGRKGGKSEK